ncbi:TPA: hypothetical protein RQK91_004227 [Vibrio vulnificus]|nr:hypothetical protein [Vibrio vulnificus]
MTVYKYRYLYDDHKCADIEAMNAANVPFELTSDGAILLDQRHKPFFAKLRAKWQLKHCKGINIYIDHKLYSVEGEPLITDPGVVERIYTQVMEQSPNVDLYTTTVI